MSALIDQYLLSVLLRIRFTWFYFFFKLKDFIIHIDFFIFKTTGEKKLYENWCFIIYNGKYLMWLKN